MIELSVFPDFRQQESRWSPNSGTVIINFSQNVKQQYIEDDEIHATIQKLLALSFVPGQDVLEVFDTIVTDLPETDDDDRIMDLIRYVERTFIREQAARGRRQGTNPHFPQNIWSVYLLFMNR